MEWVVFLLFVLGLPGALVVWLIARTLNAGRRLQELEERLARMDLELTVLRGSSVRSVTTPAPSPRDTPVSAPVPAAQTGVPSPVPPPMPPVSVARPLAVPPALPQVPRLPTDPLRPASLAAPVVAARPAPSPQVDMPPPLSPAAAPSFLEQLTSGKVDWERFVGVNLLMWLGGFAAFLTVVFAVKYSFDNNWITPELRVAAGFLAGVGLLVAGLWVHRRNAYRVGAQTLCAVGVVVLYATTFACRSIYHFAFFDVVPTFLLMTLVTATAFVLAVRLEAMVVAVLGIFAGFLTPWLLSTGEDHPGGLFGYIALLDAGLIAVALRQRWQVLTALGAVATVLMQVGWTAEFFERGHYVDGARIFVPVAVYLGFSVLFTAAWFLARRGGGDAGWLQTAAALLLPAVALAFGLFLVGQSELASRPGVIFGHVLVADLCLLALVWAEARCGAVQFLAGGAAFLCLATWMAARLTDSLLWWGMGGCLVFAVLHSAVPFVVQRRRPGVMPLWWAHLFPVLALVVMLLPFLRLQDPGLVFWGFILAVNVVAVAVAVLSGSAVWIAGSAVLTLLAAAIWMSQAPASLTHLSAELAVIGGFAVFFVGATTWMAQRAVGGGVSGEGAGDPGEGGAAAAQLPAFSAVLPFLLLLLVVLRLPLVDPSPVFGVALLLVAMMLGLARVFPLTWLPAVALGSVLSLQHVWYAERFSAGAAFVPLCWHVGFSLVFAVFPFLFRRSFAHQVIPWATAALSGPLHFYLVHRVVKSGWPNDYMGLLPVAFALPSLAGLMFLVRSRPAADPTRQAVLAWFGGAVLFFLTLVFPVQFERQWITLGWAFEGAAVLWLFRRVPHPGLRLVGLILLGVAFTRLAVNPAVLSYHPRASTPVWNWYLYAYSLVAGCLFAGARLLKPADAEVWGVRWPSVLRVLGTVLAFLLLNIEIADYFTAQGARVLTFQFSGHLGRDMTYSIGWGVFALVLVVVGIVRRVPLARYAGIALLGITLLKLFLHDLARLQALYRIGALLGVAVVAIAASFLFQRFFADAPAPEDAGPSGPNRPPAT